MAEGAYVRPPDPLEIGGGNPAYAWGKWKNRFDIYLKATGASEKPEVVKVGLLLNHIGDKCIDIHMNFQYSESENKDELKIVLAKYDEYFSKRDPQLMLRERFWNQLKREPGQSFDAWVMTVKDRAAECKFPDDFKDEAIRDKLVFSCHEDRSKLKLYDVGAKLTVEKAIQIISRIEATKIELRESKPRQSMRCLNMVFISGITMTITITLLEKLVTGVIECINWKRNFVQQSARNVINVVSSVIFRSKKSAPGKVRTGQKTFTWWVRASRDKLSLIQRPVNFSLVV